MSFYVHFVVETLRITSLTGNEQVEDDSQRALKINDDLAIDLMLGTKSLLQYAVAFTKDGFIFHEKEKEIQTKRVELVQSIIELTDVKGALINILINESANIAEIHYNGEALKNLKSPIRLYFTRADDPSFLKCAFSLDVNILDKILAENKLDSWPNPIELKIENARDLSVFGVKGQVPVSVKQK